MNATVVAHGPVPNRVTFATRKGARARQDCRSHCAESAFVIGSWAVTRYTEVPATIVQHVRAACAHLPEAYEEQAFAGVRWRIRTRTLVHVVTIDKEPSRSR